MSNTEVKRPEMKIHFGEIAKIPLLTNEEEVSLATKAAAGDNAARERLLTGNLRFVVKIALGYTGRGLEPEDLISEGYLGLMRALDHFDVKRGCRFITYAVWWIRQSITSAIMEQARLIRLPVDKELLLSQIKRTRETMDPDNKKSEDEQAGQVAAWLGVPEKRVRELLAVSRELVSLDAPAASDCEMSVGEKVAFDGEGPEDDAIDSQMKDEIEDVLSDLDDRSSRVLKLRFGLDGTGPRTLDEVGEKLCLSKERIRQIEKKALLKLQSSQRCHDVLKDYVA